MRSPIASPSVARSSSRADTRRAAYSKRRGCDRNSWTSHDTPSLARKRRCIARSYAPKARPVPPRIARGSPRPPARPRRRPRYRPFARERVQEAGGIADEQPAPAGPAGHAISERPGPGDGVDAADRPPRRRRRRRSAAWSPRSTSATARAPRSASRPRPAPAEHDPDVDPAARRPARSRRSRRRGRASARRGTAVGCGVVEVIRQADPAGRRVAACTPAARATTDRGPSAPTTYLAWTAARSAVRLADLEPAGLEIHGSHRPPEPDVGAGTCWPGRAARDRAGTGRSRPPIRHRPRRRTSGGMRSRRASRPASPGSAGRRRARVASSEPARRRAVTAAGDAKTPPARQRHVRVALEDDDLVPERRRACRDDRAGRPAADHRDLTPLDGHDAPSARALRPAAIA